MKSNRVIIMWSLSMITFISVTSSTVYTLENTLITQLDRLLDKKLDSLRIFITEDKDKSLQIAALEDTVSSLVTVNERKQKEMDDLRSSLETKVEKVSALEALLQEKVDLLKVESRENVRLEKVLRQCEPSHWNVYIVGGRTNQGSSGDSSSVDVFDLWKRSWSVATPMLDRHYHESVQLQGKLFVVGGEDVIGRELSSVDYLNPISGQWMPVRPMKTPRSSFGAVAVGHLLYACGGFDGHAPTAECEVYNSDANRWSDLPNMSVARSKLRLVVFRNSLYAIGGFDEQGNMDTVERFDLETQQWSTVQPMGSVRASPGVALYQDKLVVAGGYVAVGRPTASAEVYEPLKDQWSPLVAMNEKRAAFALANIRGELMAFGGDDGQARLCSVEKFDASENGWTAVEFSMPACKSDFSVARL